MCEIFPAMDPIRMLDYPAEDMFDLITQTLNYRRRENRKNNMETVAGGVIRRKAGDDWF